MKNSRPISRPPTPRVGPDTAGRGQAVPRRRPATTGRLIRQLGGARTGFTLIEMLLVLAILATLIAIVAPHLAGRSEQAKFTAAQTQIAAFESAIDAFEVDNGRYPRGLDELIELPSDTPNWRGPYLKKAAPLDPWGNPYVYECPGRRNAMGYDLYSVGPDGRAGGDDDIGNW